MDRRLDAALDRIDHVGIRADEFRAATGGGIAQPTEQRQQRRSQPATRPTAVTVRRSASQPRRMLVPDPDRAEKGDDGGTPCDLTSWSATLRAKLSSPSRSRLEAVWTKPGQRDFGGTSMPTALV
jgi:hypothetical protein